MTVAFAQPAIEDIESIGSFLLGHRPETFDTVLDGLILACETLAGAPTRYPFAPRFAKRGIRRRRHHPYLIFYRVRDASVEILRILHERMDHDALLSEQD